MGKREKNLAVLALLSIAQAIQASAVVALVLGNIPKTSPLTKTVLPEWQALLRPEWEVLEYRLFVLVAMACMFGWVYLKRKELEDGNLYAQIKSYLFVEIILAALFLCAGFQMSVYPFRADLAHAGIIALTVVALIVKIFWKALKEWGAAWRQLVKEMVLHPSWPGVSICLSMALIAAIIYIPNPQAVVARFFFGEQYHHNDSFVMGPAFAHTVGIVPDVDVISQYGIGFPILIAEASKIFGGFSYVNVLNVFIWGTLIYYLLWFFLLRAWWQSSVWALVAILWGIKWQMFHEGAYPLVFTYGSMTVMRYLYDVLYFGCLYMFLWRANTRYLFLAAACCGFGVFYLTSEGIYASASFMVFLVVMAILINRKYVPEVFKISKKQWAVAIAIIPTVFALCLYGAVGPHMFTKDFWMKAGEFIGYFTGGFGLAPLTQNFEQREFWRGFTGFIIPIGYLFSLLMAIGFLVFKRLDYKSMAFIVVLSVYGLGTYHYYIARSTGTSYAVVCLPLVFSAVFWLKALCEQKKFQAAAIGMLLAACFALGTNHLFISYPNIFNWSHNPMVDLKVAQPLPAGGPYFNHLFRDTTDDMRVGKNSLGNTDEQLWAENNFASDDQLVEYYRQASNFSQDVDLITQLTNPLDRVPLMSSFEITMLMQANRQPYFYYFPLVISRPMNMRTFAAISIYTKDQLKATIDQLEEDKPLYIFIERVFLSDAVPKAYFFRYPTTMLLLEYVRQHYAPYKEGQYLTAMKRIAL